MSRHIITRGPTEKKITGDYNQINFEDSDEIRRDKMEMWIAKNVGMALVKHYPNRQWGVRVNIESHMCIISCDSLSLTRGYHLFFKADSLTRLQERAVMAAGEILERFGVSRAKKFDSDVIEALPRNIRDEVISEDADAVR
jgi:hypothetical protein